MAADWEKVGTVAVRVYLTGRVRVECGELLLDQAALPGAQGRLVFAMLAAQHGEPLPRDAIADALWPEALPPSWETALSAVLSTLRARLSRVGLPRIGTITVALGCYQLNLPGGTWIDLHAARHALDEAEGALRQRDPARAYGWSGVTAAVARRPFLPGEEGAWVEQQRTALRRLLVRALDCFTEIFIWSGETALAVEAAREAVTLEPYRETGYQHLMRAHAARGDRAEALRAYARCRRVLADELGIDPSPPTEAVYRELLQLA